MGLLGLLVVDQGRNISTSVLNVLLLANPTDVYRMLNLAGTASVSAFAGMAGARQRDDLGAPVLVAALLIWIFCRWRSPRASSRGENYEPPRTPPGDYGHCCWLRPQDRYAATSAVSSHGSGRRPLLRHEPPRT